MKKTIIITLLIAFTSCGTRHTRLQYPDKALHIDEYSITYTKRLDWAGPAYYRYEIYKNGLYESYGFPADNDSCLLRFEENRQRYVYFNLCNATKQVYIDTKAAVDIEQSIRSWLRAVMVQLSGLQSGRWANIPACGTKPNLTD